MSSLYAFNPFSKYQIPPEDQRLYKDFTNSIPDFGWNVWGEPEIVDGVYTNRLKLYFLRVKEGVEMVARLSVGNEELGSTTPDEIAARAEGKLRSAVRTPGA